MHCAMQWIQIPLAVIRLIPPRRRTHMKAQMTVFPFITYVPVNSAQIEFQLLIRYRTKVSRPFFVYLVSS